MLALTVVYTCLFFYIRIQARQFENATSTSGTHSSLETGDPIQAIDSPPLTKKTVATTVESASQAQTNVESSTSQRMNRVSVALLLYPAVYVILVLPVAIARISEFLGERFSLRAVYVGGCLFSLQGFAQVVLYTTTRKGIIPWNRMFRKVNRSASTKTVPLEAYRSTSYDL